MRERSDRVDFLERYANTDINQAKFAKQIFPGPSLRLDPALPKPSTASTTGRASVLTNPMRTPAGRVQEGALPPPWIQQPNQRRQRNQYVAGGIQARRLLTNPGRVQGGGATPSLDTTQ